MPTNPNKVIRQARLAIDLLMNRLPDDGMNYLHLVKSILLQHAVSERMVKQFINDYYIDLGSHEIKDDWIKKVQ